METIIFTIIMVMTTTVRGQTTCNANEEFVVNIYRCQNTCETYGRTFDCGDTYKPNGACYCKNGFARLTEGGVCIAITDPQCAPKLPPKKASCGANEVFYERLYSGHHANGDDSCKLFKVIPKFIVEYEYNYYSGEEPNYFDYQPIKWGPHCECKKSYARNANEKCVPNNSTQCANLYKPTHAQCALRGETYATGPSCQQNCYNALGDIPTITCDNTVTAACYCPSGTYRLTDYKNTCVILQDCQPMPQGGK